MPFNVTRSAQFYDKEVLKFPAGLDAIASAVIDGNSITYVADTRTVLPAGTILKLSVSRAGTVVPYNYGNDSPAVFGILARPVDFIASSTAASEPVPVFFHECVFATTAIVGFTAYISALASSLPTCLFK